MQKGLFFKQESDNLEGMAVQGKRAAVKEQILAHLNGNDLAKRVFEKITFDQRYVVACDMANSVAVHRLGYNDHGRTHAGIVAANALAILNLLRKHGVQTTFEKEGYGDFADAQLVTLLGALLHDVGNAVHRHEHEWNGVFVAMRLLDKILRLPATQKNERLLYAVLQCIASTNDEVQAISIEAGAVKAADGTDCENGRSRVPYRQYKKRDIHALSALAIRRVEILEGDGLNGNGKPVRVVVDMENEAGIFQTQNVLQLKVDKSGLKDFISVEPLIDGKPFEDVNLAR